MAVILGLNLAHADSSAAIMVDGRLLCAVAEERLNRKKHCASFPQLAIQACLDVAGVKLTDVTHVGVCFDPNANKWAKAAYALANPLKIYNLLRIRQRKASLDFHDLLASTFGVDRAALGFQLTHIEHHLGHIASSYYASEYDEAAGFSYDGSGDFVSCMMARCQGTRIEALTRTFLPHSPGLFYTACCQFIGYNKFGDEGKVMGLAPYGKDTYHDFFEKLIKIDGTSIVLDQAYFKPIGSDQGLVFNEDGSVGIAQLFTDAWVKQFGPPRVAHSEITQRDMDLAYGMQHRFEQVAVALLNRLHERVPSERVTIAGGCALNSVLNGKIFDATPFRQTYIQPAASDDGLSVGACYWVWHNVLNRTERCPMTHGYWGPSFSDAACEAAAKARGLTYLAMPRPALLASTADSILAGEVVGWFQGQMEWGPRALGNRSILANPGHPKMKDILNARIKRREWFRPFAPSVKAERVGELFEHDHPSPFMLHVYKIRPEWRERLCAVNHVDNTGRLQTVTRAENPMYYDLICELEKRNGVPVVLNTSFNENEPIVCRPEEAVDCFIRSKMDTLVLGNVFVRRSDNPQIGAPNQPI